MNNNQLSPEDYSLLVEASADERQMQNFFSPDVEESEEDEEEWESQPVSSEEAEVYYERQMESWMDGRGEGAGLRRKRPSARAHTKKKTKKNACPAFYATMHHPAPLRPTPQGCMQARPLPHPPFPQTTAPPQTQARWNVKKTHSAHTGRRALPARGASTGAPGREPNPAARTQ